MSLYVTRNPHKTALRHHDHGDLQPAEKQRHPSDGAIFYPALWCFMTGLVAFAAGFSWGASL